MLMTEGILYRDFPDIVTVEISINISLVLCGEWEKFKIKMKLNTFQLTNCISQMF